MATITHIICFDIDGTLVKTDPSSNMVRSMVYRSLNNGPQLFEKYLILRFVQCFVQVHKDAFSHAMKHVFSVDARIEEIAHQGMTDMWILEEVLERRGVSLEASRERMPELKEAMVEYCQKHAGDIVSHTLPGVPELLAALSARTNVIVGLVTGNLEDIGRMKLKASNLAGHFSFGGFGSDMKDRGELIRLAVRRAAAVFPTLDAASCQVVHFGDTPFDLKAAATAGALGIGVTTGIFSKEQLQEVPGGPWTVLETLEDTTGVLRLLGL